MIFLLVYKTKVKLYDYNSSNKGGVGKSTVAMQVIYTIFV